MATKKQRSGSRGLERKPLRPADWSGLLKSSAAASPEFMRGVEKLPMHEHSAFATPRTQLALRRKG